MSYSDFRREDSRGGVGGFAVASDASDSARADFIRLTYLHLGGAILAFAGLTAALINSSFAPALMSTLAGSPYSWLVVLVAFMLVGWVAERWAMSAVSPAMQYAGLGLYVVAQSIIFVPLLFIASRYAPGVIPTAGVLTATIFGGLTATVLLTKKDFSFMGRALAIASFGALGLIIVSILFGFSLGGLFAAAMIVLMAGYILYQTSNVLHHYPVGSHVAASLALFASVATLFWYVVRLLMSLRE